MQKKLISFVQPNFCQGPKELNSYYLPYSAGIILSHAFSFEDIASHWHLDQLIWQRDSIESTAKKLASNHLVAFSTYVWNRRYNYTLARRVKELNPECLIVFGGPEPAIENRQLFEQEPYMDIVVKHEGELTFCNILRQFDQKKFDHVPGLLINSNGTAIDTGPNQRIEDLSVIPSPYLSGVFDQLIKDYPDVVWNATLETNRGCPYQCTFCDWGSLTYSKVKKFDLQRVLDELEWIGKHCGYVTIADANFGMFIDRDNIIVDKLIEIQKKYKKVSNFSMTWAKNQKNEVVDIVKKLIEQSPNPGVGLTVSVQSMDHDVLDNIKRRNLDQHKINEIFAICDRNNIPVYTELILGLPGETVESWKESIWKIFRAGNHTGVNILHCQLLENSEMNLLQRRLYQLEAVPVVDYINETYGDHDLQESIDVVVSTKTIPREVMLDTLVWNTFIQTFHINGLTTYIARFLEKSYNVDYSEFYELLYQDTKHNPWLMDQLDQTRQYYVNWITHGQAHHPNIGNVGIFGWNLMHRITLLLLQEQKIDQVFDFVDQFLTKHFDLPRDLQSQLLKFQKNYIIKYEELKSFPKVLKFDYDFLGYTVNNTPVNSACAYQFDTIEDTHMTLDRFLENIHFGRKRNFGKAFIKKI